MLAARHAGAPAAPARARRGAPLRDLPPPHAPRPAMTASVLDGFPGVGPARKKALLAHFGSPDAVLAASRQDLEGVPGLPPKVARDLHALPAAPAARRSRRAAAEYARAGCTPRTQYARNGDVSIAYQVHGRGPDRPRDRARASSRTSTSTGPGRASSASRTGSASFSRLIRFDKRGTGLSDPVPGVPTLEERMEDVRAVLDAVGSERAALFGYSEGGPMAALFAATYPERTLRLVMYGTFPAGTSLGPSGRGQFIDHRREPLGRGRDPRHLRAEPRARRSAARGVRRLRASGGEPLDGARADRRRSARPT